MSKKSFFVILGLSVATTLIATVVDAINRNSLLAGQAGVPLRFDSSSLFGGGSINYVNLTLDIIFWFIVVWVIWKVIFYFSGRGGR